MTRETICAVRKVQLVTLVVKDSMNTIEVNFSVIGYVSPSSISFSGMLKSMCRIPALQNSALRNIHTSTFCRLRKITIQKPDEKTTIIDCKYVKSPRESYVLKLNQTSSKCPLCQLKLNLKYTDVLILCQYIDSQGHLLKRSDTHLCKTQYKLISELIHMAQYAGLLPEPPRDEPKKPYNLLNTYYDETTINLHSKPIKRHLKYIHLKDKLSPLEKYRVRPEIGSYYGPKV